MLFLFYRYLYTTFGFEQPPHILHGVFFKHTEYLKKEMEITLNERLKVKHLLENETLSREDLNVLQSKASTLKLKLNSSYGYSLCRMEAEHSPYTKEKVLTLNTIR